MRSFLLLAVLTLVTPVHAQERGFQALAFVVHDRVDLAVPDVARFAENFRRRLGEPNSLGDIDGGDEAAVLRIAGGTLMIGRLNNRIPNEELERACVSAWYRWKEACEVAKTHKSHYVVGIMGSSLDSIDAKMALTHAVAALLEESAAVGVYWVSNFVSREEFLLLSQKVSRKAPPVRLWVSFRLSREMSGRPTMSTSGLSEFKLMEIEAKDAKIEARELFSLVAGMAQYLISSGPIIKDGETVGHSATHRVRVRHAESCWNEGQNVYRLEF